MDNIKKKTSLQVITDVSKYISVTVPAIVDIFGVVALFASGLQRWIDTHIGSVASIIIIAVLNLLLVANIFVIVEKTTGMRANKAVHFISGYKKFLEHYTGYLLYFEDQCKKITSVEELYSTTSSCLKALVDDVSDVLSRTTGKKVRACIKAFPEKYEHHDTFRMELMTFCRSDKTLIESAEERASRVPVHENTDFKLIMVGTYPYFAFNNLKNFKKETKIEYENSTEKWDKKYLATIVFPISKHISTYKSKDSFEVLGFLCVDTINTQAFSGDVGPMCIDFIASLSHLLYTFLDKAIQCRDALESKQQVASASVSVP